MMKLVLVALCGARVASMCGRTNAYCPSFSRATSCAEHEIRWGNSWYLCEWDPKKNVCAVGPYCGSLADRLPVDTTSVTTYDWSTPIVPPSASAASCNSSSTAEQELTRDPCGDPNIPCPYVGDAELCLQVRARWDSLTWFKCKWDQVTHKCDWDYVCLHSAAAQKDDFQWELLTRSAPPRVDSLDAFLQTLEKPTLEKHVHAMIQSASAMCAPASECLTTRIQGNNGSLCLVTMATKTSKGAECACRGLYPWPGSTTIAYDVHYGEPSHRQASWIAPGQTSSYSSADSVCYITDTRWV